MPTLDTFQRFRSSFQQTIRRTNDLSSLKQPNSISISSLQLLPTTTISQRETIRTAISLLCKQLQKSSSTLTSSKSAQSDWDNVQLHIRALLRLERIWSKSRQPSSTPPSSTTPSSTTLSSTGFSASGEERERRLFADALRDGFVLCYLMNKLRSSSILRPDPREDGFTRTSNITKFLAACASYGLSSHDLFQRNDLIEPTAESLTRVARTIIALIAFVDSPIPERKKSISAQGKSPYAHPSSRAAAASTPNLPSPSSPTRKRLSPPSGLPTLRSDFPIGRKSTDPIPMPPPRSPLRALPPSKRPDDDLTPLPDSSSIPPTSSIPSSSLIDPRQSTASTDTTAYSSLFEVRKSKSNHNKYGTIRTVTTDATSESPSFTRTEGSSVAASLIEDRKHTDTSPKFPRDRRASETPVVDLSRVAEEPDESGSSGKGARTDKVEAKEKIPAIRLGKGKWPDDFIEAVQARSPGRSMSTKSSSPDHGLIPAPISASPPRKLAVVGATRRNESLESIPQFPRRPTHRSRHSDTSALLPRDPSLHRDSSPEAGMSRVVLRRHNTKPNGSGAPQRNGIYFEEKEGDSLVPFPQATSGATSPSPASSSDDRVSDGHDKPRPPRGRFQSDIEGSSSRRVRPNSYDDLGAKPMRSRFESMVNLGVASSNASASDLLTRDSMDGSAVRKTLIVREEGKPPTHFQLGNCIGRGQFGSVYRALNLNTGQMVAVKRIRLEGLKEEEVTQLMREVDLVRSLSHPSIVKYEGMARDNDTLSIVLEYAENGSLGQTLKAFGKLNERLVASYVVKILEGLHYLHQSDVVHCDLKAANILTTKNGNVKLSDFGVSLNLRAMEREFKDVAGTPNWMAPEVIELKGPSTKADIWSLACTVIELLTGRPPYADITNSMSVMFRIVEDKMPPIPDGCSDLLQDFLVRCFNKDPTKRPSAEILFEHPWLKKNWGAHKELRPQDSIPFLRRVSADLQKSEAVRFLSHIEMPVSDTPISESPRLEEFMHGSPPRLCNGTRPAPDNDTISPREHSFVKTTFSKQMVCRVCLLNVKKSAVLCEQCSLIAHSKCAVNAPPTCDLRAQLLLYAQYAEKGNPASAYSNPVEFLEGLPTSPRSEVTFVTHSPRTSLDSVPPAPSSPVPHPPTAFRLIATAFRRSKSNLSHEAAQSVPPNPSPLKPRDDKAAVAASAIAAAAAASRSNPVPIKRKEAKVRPLSFSSTSTSPNTSSMRSAATAAESFSSKHGVSKLSVGSVNDTEGGGSRLSVKGEESRRSSRLARSPVAAADLENGRPGGVPGGMPAETPRLKKHSREAKSSSGCTVQ